mgnify:FL=1
MVDTSDPKEWSCAPEAAKVCLEGAIYRAGLSEHMVFKSFMIEDWWWNDEDGRTQEEVIQVLVRAERKAGLRP